MIVNRTEHVKLDKNPYIAKNRKNDQAYNEQWNAKNNATNYEIVCTQLRLEFHHKIPFCWTFKGEIVYDDSYLFPLRDDYDSLHTTFLISTKRESVSLNTCTYILKSNGGI